MDRDAGLLGLLGDLDGVAAVGGLAVGQQDDRRRRRILAGADGCGGGERRARGPRRSPCRPAASSLSSSWRTSVRSVDATDSSRARWLKATAPTRRSFGTSSRNWLTALLAASKRFGLMSVAVIEREWSVASTTVACSIGTATTAWGRASATTGRGRDRVEQRREVAAHSRDRAGVTAAASAGAGERLAAAHARALREHVERRSPATTTAGRAAQRERRRSLRRALRRPSSPSGRSPGGSSA